MPTVAEPEQAEGLDDYHRVRFHEARESGLTRVEADRFAHGETPLQTLRKLRADGCSGALIARIVC